MLDTVVKVFKLRQYSVSNGSKFSMVFNTASKCDSFCNKTGKMLKRPAVKCCEQIEPKVWEWKITLWSRTIMLGEHISQEILEHG